MRRRVAIPTFVVPYRPVDYDRWGQDLSFVRSTIQRCGTSGGEPDRFFNQSQRAKGHQHFTEVWVACHLVERGVQPASLMYENYYLSKIAFDAAKDRSRKKVFGTERLRAAVTDEFFTEFDRLLQSNQSAFGTRGADALHLDFAVIEPDRKCVRFIECKRVRPNGSPETFKDHQLALLGILTQLITDGDGRLLRPGWKGRVEIATLMPDNVTLAEDAAPLMVEYDDDLQDNH
jgi:hypothetical protein